jgi:hypothetical protein
VNNNTKTKVPKKSSILPKVPKKFSMAPPLWCQVISRSSFLFKSRLWLRKNP